MSELLVFNIQRYSLHDGEGIRTLFFLKGCPLRCRWCCNPESQLTRPELIYRREKCLGCDKCGLCKDMCSGGFVSFDPEGRAKPDFGKCNSESLDWVEVCPSKALDIKGRYEKIDDLLDIAERDQVFYGNNGGITLSGGEPLMQENSIEMLRQAKIRRLHTAIETCGCVPKDRLLTAAEYLDEMFIDLKSLNDKKHKAWTGATVKGIADNIKALCDAFPNKKKTIRTPVIPGFNDTDEDLSRIEKFVEGLMGAKWEKLPYHTYGVYKYGMLGREYEVKA